MAEAPETSGNALVDATALQDIATNGALLNQATSRLIETVQRMGDIVLPVPHGGTGQSSYVIGDLLYADTTTSLARLPDVAVGKVLVSGGVGAPPAWGDVPSVSSSNITGVISVANGGTGLSTLMANNLLVGNGTSNVSLLAPGSSGNFLVSNGTAWAGTAAATAAQYRDDTAGSLALTPSAVWDSADFVALTDAATIAVDLATGFNFSVTIGGNRTLGNPTNTKVGQSGVISVTASGATRTINVSSNWKKTSAIAFPISIASGQTCYISYFVVSSTIILVTGALNNPT